MLGSVRQGLVTVLVKALPRPSRIYSETVCCAGVTDNGEWKRLFPIRFRHSGEEFRRWDRISFSYADSKQDKRAESCRVIERSIRIAGQTGTERRREIIEPLITGSFAEAAAKGQSLTAIRPRNIRFYTKRKSPEDIEDERSAYIESARQNDFLDEEVKAFEPSPLQFRMAFEDDAGKHDFECGDWETHTTFWRFRQKATDEDAIRQLKEIYEVDYARRGMIFVLGNMASRPQTWLLLGIVRLDHGPFQASLF